jgi:hypothetical protein
MGFLDDFATPSTRVDLTPADHPKGHYWATVQALPGAQKDRVEAKRMRISATASPGKAAQAAQLAKVRAAKARMGLVEEEPADETDAGVTTSIAVDQAAYRMELLTHAVVEWNLTDERGAALPLAPEAAKRASLERLPARFYDQLVDAAEALINDDAAERSPEAEAEFRGGAETSSPLG